jgi:hypothetical protein
VKTIERLAELLQMCWSADTAVDPDKWTENCPERGQCAVTAMIVQDEFGGDLIRCMVGDESHYYNRVDFTTVDLTGGQFAEWWFAKRPETVPRSRCTDHPDTLRRYHLLRSRLDDLL